MRTRDREKFARRCNAIADKIVEHPEKFDMRQVFFGPEFYRSSVQAGDFRSAKQFMNNCGTTACIAGWAISLNPRCIHGGGSWAAWGVQARTILGLTDEEAADLFYKTDGSAEWAVGELRRIAAEYLAGTRG